MNINILEQDATVILGSSALSELKEWYEDTLRTGWDYVVFTVRRSYILALIMEKLTGKKMEENSEAIFLTDASLFLHCKDMAECYMQWKRFPRILLCDDTIIHGRNINHFIECIENELFSLLPDAPENEIRTALVDAMKIHAYVRSETPLLLLGRYELNLRFKKRVNAELMHKLSSSISTLILHADIANASYIFSEHIAEKEFRKIDLTKFVNTSYQNTQQFANIRYVGLTEEKKGIFTIRIIKNPTQKGYRVLPFVFLPNLGNEETLKILKVIQERMRIKGLNEKYINWMNMLERFHGKRSFNELITLLFSQTLLQEFNKKYEIEQGMFDDEEICKLARNYNLSDFETAKEMIKVLAYTELFTSEEIAQILEKIVLPERELLRVSKRNKIPLSYEKQIKIKENIEDYFYKKGVEEESAAYELAQKPYYPTRKRSVRTVRGCGFLLRELNSNYSEAEADYSIAFFLQMMDAGVLCVSSYASNSVRVVGVAQFAKAGEQSLLIKPLRLYEWIPVISIMQRNCEWRGTAFNEELERYGASPECDMNNEIRGDIKQFIKELASMGQKAEDWNGNYLVKKEFAICKEDEDEEVRLRIQFIDQQLRHMKSYDSYYMK